MDELEIQGQLKSGITFEQAAGGGFSDLAGMEELKQQMRDEVLWVLQNRKVAQRYKLRIPNGMLLYGPPGCGKTFFAQKFAEECQLPYAYVRGSDLANMYSHATQCMIADMFHKAEENAPCIICLDEIDSIIGRRNTNPDYVWLNAETTEFLTQMNNCGEKGIFIIGTTNFPNNIDPAALRSGRMDKFVYIPEPDKPTRIQLFRKELECRPTRPNIDFEALADLTEGASCSDIDLMVSKAALQAALHRRNISQLILEDIIRKMCGQKESEQSKQEEATQQPQPEIAVKQHQPCEHRIGFLAKQYCV